MKEYAFIRVHVSGSLWLSPKKGGMEAGRERGTEELPFICYTSQHHLKSHNKLTLHWQSAKAITIKCLPYSPIKDGGPLS